MCIAMLYHKRNKGGIVSDMLYLFRFCLLIHIILVVTGWIGLNTINTTNQCIYVLLKTSKLGWTTSISINTCPSQFLNAVVLNDLENICLFTA